jgi:hypothetical protein
VVVNDLDIRGITIGKPKTHTPLVIDANAPLTLSFARELFLSIIWRYAQFLHANDPVEHRQLAHSHPLDIPESCNALPEEQRRGVFAPERLDGHWLMPTHPGSNVQQ